MRCLGDFLNQESFDLVLLEEVWSEQDFQYLRQKLLFIYLVVYYFWSGIIGSGFCVFFKYLIQEFIQYIYIFNGYFYMIYYGDWFSGKVVGLLVFYLSGMVFNVYVIYFYVEYN